MADEGPPGEDGPPGGDGPPDQADPTGERATVVAAREALLVHLVAFARALRRQGAQVPPDATLTGARAIAVVGLEDRDRVRIALRAALVSRQEDLAAFERLFPAFWQRVVDDPSVGVPGGVEAQPEPAGAGTRPDQDPAVTPGDATAAGTGRPVRSRLEVSAGDEPPDEAGAADESSAVYSPTGRPEPVEADPLAAVDDDALAEPIRQLTTALATRRGRRWVAGGDERPDVRRALRRSVETGGAVVELPGRDRRPSGVRAVLLVDVSRSVLDSVDRGFLVAFLRAVREAWRDVAVFFFDTSVREVSDAFDEPTAEAALAALADASAAWGGGTRIGHALETVRREQPTLVDRQTVVLVVSDGLEVGEIDVLELELAWLAGRAATVLWANPLAGAASYEPTCRGMAAALPYLDGLFAFTGPADVAEMARQLARHGPGDRVGYAFDRRRRPASAPRKR